MPAMLIAFLYLFLGISGAAALIYQIVWMRSLALVFGESPLAVTTVVVIFMAGLALGSLAAGRRIDRSRQPLKLFGLLQLGIALSTLVCAGVVTLYPSLYRAVAIGRDSTAYLTVIRILFAVVVLLVPTMLMGATLPTIASILARQPDRLRRHLAPLYAVNTLGGAVGAVLAAFVFLRFFTVSTTLLLTVAMNTAIGLASLVLQSKIPTVSDDADQHDATTTDNDEVDPRLARLVLWGIGVSGFCAFGYQVLWTRVLALGIASSTYGLTIILAAFLTGIALGSETYGAVMRVVRLPSRRLVAWFGLAQLAIGITACLVTVYLRDLSVNFAWLRSAFLLAFLYFAVPAFFMGAAFPMAGEALSRYRRATGRAVGDTLAAQTLGAAVGAAVSSLWLVQWLGIERALQILSLINAGVGLVVLTGLRRPRWLPATAAIIAAAAATVLVLNPTLARSWDRSHFAIIRSNQPEALRTPELVREAIQNTDVLYYKEGTESIVSVIKLKGGDPSVIVNGRLEASSDAQALQTQFLLGHLPALLSRDRRRVLVVGMGSGITAGATGVHPDVEQVILAEAEPAIRQVVRPFDELNHHLLDNPKLKLVANDGRNFLLTTNEAFDVITTEPPHPLSPNAGSFFTSDYFTLVARHLRPGGVAAQWLPLYGLNPGDLRSVVKSFQQGFAHAMLWRTHDDAVLIGGNEPFIIDEAALARRMAEPEIARDLRQVEMGSPAALLSYFVMGTDGLARFSKDGALNTDDRLYLEFSAPLSTAAARVTAANIQAISTYRESLLSYLIGETDSSARAEQQKRWDGQMAAARLADRAAAQLLSTGPSDPAVAAALRQLSTEHSDYAPGRALSTEVQTALALEPRLLDKATFNFTNADGKPLVVHLAAVLVPISKGRASIMFVDNSSRTVYGQAFLDDYDREGRANRFAWDVLVAAQAAYDRDFLAARDQHQESPAALAGLKSITAVIESKVKSVQPGS